MKCTFQCNAFSEIFCEEERTSCKRILGLFWLLIDLKKLPTFFQPSSWRQLTMQALGEKGICKIVVAIQNVWKQAHIFCQSQVTIA